MIKLATWAKKFGIHYQTAWKWFKQGKMPIRSEKLPSGMIVVYEDENNDEQNKKK